MANEQQLEQPQIIKVKELLGNDKIKIPIYQRPYKWTIKNVDQLIDDILLHKDKSEYRLGTLILHEHDNVYDIVDGQQRTITLILFAYALIQKKNKTNEEMGFNLKLLNLTFTNDISKANIKNNYRHIQNRIANFDDNIIRFFLEKCTFVQIILKDVSEAFQFFDSQNTRGKELEPHDLLKAFHLREMNNSTEEERKKAVEKWESIDTQKLADLFSQYLFRIRNWSNGNSAQYFTKNDIDVFKGINPYVHENYPYAATPRIAHFYVEEYNSFYHRNIDKREMDFPFQIDGIIINGKRFFEMIKYYNDLIDKVQSKEMQDNYPILKLIETYEGAYRTGDKYIHNMFYCALIYYIDRFGYNDLQKAIEKIFIWAYSLRMKLQAVHLVSVDNYALNKAHSRIHLFKIIKEAIHHNEVIKLQFEILRENNSSKTDDIVDQFKKLGYYE